MWCLVKKIRELKRTKKSPKKRDVECCFEGNKGLVGRDVYTSREPKLCQTDSSWVGRWMPLSLYGIHNFISEKDAED